MTEPAPTARQSDRDVLVKHVCVERRDSKKIFGDLDDAEDYFVFDDIFNEVAREASCWGGFKNYVFLFWDGLGFWGTDVTKLDRLKKGKYYKAPGWFDRYKSSKYVISSLVFMIAFGIIIYSEIERIGDI